MDINLLFCGTAWQTNITCFDANFFSCFNFHTNIDIRIFTISNLSIAIKLQYCTGDLIKALDFCSVTHRLLVWLQTIQLSGDDVGQVVHRHVPLSPNSMIFYQSHGSNALQQEGHHRTDVAIAMHYRLKLFIKTRGLRKGNEHHTYTPHVAWHSLP